MDTKENINNNSDNKSTDQNISYYVGVGASAGGLEALEQLFSNMPADTGMTFIVIQHLSPDFKSLMVELLSKKTEMPVKRAEDGMIVEPNTIYLIPPKKNLQIFHSKLLLSESDHSKGINLPIDVFFRSLAEDQAEKAIGIILSGTGSDGVKGIRAIKESGGLVMVQSEESAKFDGMPRAAISTGLADFILPPDEMPAKLQSLAKHPFAPKQERPTAILSDEDGMTRIFALLREKTKVDFSYYKPSTIVRRIERRMTVNQINELKEYVNFLELHPGEINALYKELLIGVTSFFRDKEVFDELLDNYLPKLFQNSDNRELRFWVAGCSTGEEAYSLAILAKECMERLEKRYDVKIFATDIDKDAIIKASNGIYPDSISADISPRILTKYFSRKNDTYQIDRSIREMVIFAQHNIIKDPPFTNIDLLSCRNLLIYLQPVLQKRALEFMNFSIKSDGILVLGTSETTGESSDLFEPLNIKFKIYKSRGRKRQINDNLDTTHTGEPKFIHYRNRYYSGSQILRAHEEERLLERLVHSIATEYFKLAIVVNQQLEVLHIIGETEGILKVPTGKNTNELSKMVVKDLSIPMISGIQNLFKTNEGVKYTNIKFKDGDSTKTIQIKVKLLPTKKSQEPYALVLIEDITNASVYTSKDSELVFDISKETEQRIHDLEHELQFTRENLQATIEELETSNEELQATNEELLASNEELQSTNEELQSVNEELHTVNSEYQSKIIELTEANNDIDNIISRTKIAILFLDENLEIRRFSPEIRRIFKIIDSDIGRPINHIQHTIRNYNLFEAIHSVATSGNSISEEINSENNDWFLMKIFPYQVGNKKTSGISITFLDITELKRATIKLEDHRSKIESILRAAPFGVGIVKQNRFVQFNDKLCELLQYTKEELLNKNIDRFFINSVDHLILERNVLEQMKLLGTSVLETRWLKKDGTDFPVLLTTAPLESDSLERGYTIIVQDLSSKLNAFEIIKASEDRYKILFNTMNFGVVYQNAKGEIISSNQKAQEILGLSTSEMVGRTSEDSRWRAIKIDGSDFPGMEHPAMQSLLTGKPVKGVVMGIHNPSKNELRWIKINSVPLFKEGETKPYQVFSTFEDITDIILSERELTKSQERLDVSTELSGLAWWEWDIKNNQHLASPLKKSILGFENEDFDISIENWLTRIHPEDQNKFKDSLNDYIAGKIPIFDIEYRIKTKDENWISLRDTAKIVGKDPDGAPIKLIGIIKKV